MRITRLQLKNWRNFGSLEIKLGERNFFVGPNAAGKSNLLDAVRFLRDLVSVGGGFREALRRRGGLGEIRALSATSNTSIGIGVTLGDDDIERKWRYRLDFTAHGPEKAPIVLQEHVTEWVDGQKFERLERKSSARSDVEGLGQTHLEQSSSNQKFREIASFLASIKYLHLVPQILREPSRSIGESDPYGGDLIEKINKTKKRVRDRRLKLMEDALKVAVPKLSKLELDTDERGVPHLRAKYEHWRRNGAWQQENRFSDGTLRLLGLIWSLQEHGGPMLFEEPELSLNPAVVTKLAPLISKASRLSGRQSLITTHSLDLLSSDVSLEEVFMLVPDRQGTSLVRASDRAEIAALVGAGIPVGEAVLPYTATTSASKLSQLEIFAS